MTREHYASFPEALSVRELKTSGRVLLTTLLDHRRIRKQQLFDLYCQRWQVELDLRNIKITLGVDVLSCHTPQMVVKELWVHLLAYNLIRLLMAQAAATHDVEPRQLSFKHTVQLWTEWTARHPTHRTVDGHANLWQLLARVRVANRAGRVEPRMKKRRPKQYPWMKKSRPQERAQIIIHASATA